MQKGGRLGKKQTNLRGCVGIVGIHINSWIFLNKYAPTDIYIGVEVWVALLVLQRKMIWS